MYFLNLTLVFISILCLLLKISIGSGIFALIGGVLSILLFFTTAKNIKITPFIFCAAVGIYIFIFGLINANIEGRDYLLYYFYFISSSAIAISIRRLGMELMVSKFLLIVSLVWFSIKAIGLGYNPDAYNDLIDGSRNFISGYMILFLVYYLYACRIHNIKISIIYSILVTIACFILYGRSGIALSLSLLCISIFTRYGRKSILLIFIITICMGLLYAVEISSLIQNSNFSHGVETERSEMLAQYLASIKTPYDILFGVDFFECCSLIARFDGNPHNSFIMLHARFGIFPFLLFIFFYLYQAFSGIIFKTIYFNILVLIVLIRYSLDQFGLFGPVDFILFSIVIFILIDPYRMANAKC